MQMEVFGWPHAYDLTVPDSAPESTPESTPESAPESALTSASPPTLVFVHGWMLSRHYWQPLIQLLSPIFPCLCYDLRGFGQSQQPLQSQPGAQSDFHPTNFHPTNFHPTNFHSTLSTSPYSLQAYAQDLGQLLQQLQIQGAWLIGHSLGGSVALWAAKLFPQQILGVIGVNAGGGIYLKTEFERFRAAGVQLVNRRPRWLLRIPLLDLVFTRAMVRQPLARCWGRQRLVDFLTAAPEAALGALLESTTEPEVHELPRLMAHLPQPVYLLAGAQDQIMESKYVHHLASFHGLFEGCGANVVELANCGHLAMLEQTEAVAYWIRGWVMGQCQLTCDKASKTPA